MLPCTDTAMYCDRGDKPKAEMTAEEKAEAKQRRMAADKLRKKKVNAPGRIVKIQASKIESRRIEWSEKILGCFIFYIRSL